MGDHRRGLAVALAALLAAGLAGCASGAPAVTAPSGVGVGQPAPDFAATALDGSRLTLSQFRGRPVWLTFGATWCAQCRAEAPDIQAAFEQARASGAEVVWVYLSEDAAAVRTYVERLGLTFVHIPDPQGLVSERYRVTGVPFHVFIDPSGVVDAVRFGVLSREQMDGALSAASG